MVERRTHALPSAAQYTPKAGMKKISDHTKYGLHSTKIVVSHQMSYQVTTLDVPSGHELANEMLCSFCAAMVRSAPCLRTILLNFPKIGNLRPHLFTLKLSM
jgi:hypothetical protein